MSSQDKVFVIKNPISGLVLDGSEYKVTLQKLTGSKSQQWTMECTEFGRFIIINKKSGNALDVENKIEECAAVITYEKHGNINQQWHINGDNTIECPKDSLVLDIYNGDFTPGNNIIVFEKHGGENQQFVLQYPKEGYECVIS